MSIGLKIFWGLVGAAVLGFGGLAWWVTANVDRPVGTGRVVTVTVAKGEGVRTVANHLADRRLIRSASAWTLYVVSAGLRSSLLPGEYQVDSAMTGRQIAHLLATDQTAATEVTVKIVEGLTAADIAAVLEKNSVLATRDFLAAVAVTDSRRLIPDRYYQFLTDKPAAAGLDGFLFPDTYRFFRHSTAPVVLRKFLDNFNGKFTPAMRQQSQATGRTYYQIVTMASILEAELKTDADRAMAADIFWRRFDAAMGLDADTTVLYALGVKKKTLTNADLNIDSPYNTYKYRGLPPGPIDNPGLSALRAAINPIPNAYWYYLTGSDGKTYFAKTLEEHNRNKQLYLK